MTANFAFIAITARFDIFDQNALKSLILCFIVKFKIRYLNLTSRQTKNDPSNEESFW
ncbi:hypothetical protein FC70_GL001304 [Paucilactobacillus oligofermentans DSM 15707 = LMG 22743]|uniref:Uncharacterized protein n=1 Tax=Paucilactobacillus oligofermentans DSM 15707 = LMG 22743 TaxID=1423778 RepID=A0A0R1RKH5_9LACO|nr:hypothetical protein FC70_GL001304 [Paucilactobacillus oligofermentans DSM 15707 = LMG 22743]